MDEENTRLNSGGDASSDDSTPMLPPIDSADEQDIVDDMDQAESMDPQTVPIDRALVTTPEEAADSDLIEKEWVLKAKQIVEHTAEDPFKQQEELSKIKADYMKKRYNKDIGLPT